MEKKDYSIVDSVETLEAAILNPDTMIKLCIALKAG